MPHRFKVHYTPEEARALLPQVREWREELGTISRLAMKTANLSLNNRPSGRVLTHGVD